MNHHKCLRSMASAKTNLLASKLVPFTIIMLYSLTRCEISLQAAATQPTVSMTMLDELSSSSNVDSDGFTIDPQLSDSVEDEHRSTVEMLKEESIDSDQAERKSSRHQFKKSCPYGYFTCANGECLSPRWRCDGHYDCDDFSDELNCTKIELPQNSAINSEQSPIKPVPSSRSQALTEQQQPKGQHEETIGEMNFNSTIEPLMLFSTGLSIRAYWMRSRIYFDVVSKGSKSSKNEASPTITQALSIFFDMLSLDRPATPTAGSKSDESNLKSRSTIVGVDMDPNDKEVFWVELGKDAGVFSTVIDDDQFESRHRRQFTGPKHKTIVDSGLLSPEDIALDNVGKNVYITDAGLPAIVVCSIKHSYCKMIVNQNLHKPRAIIADSSTGWLTYTDWGDHPGIFLVSMDGKLRETLIDTDVVWPNGLAADYSTNQLYWADARLSKIERIDLSTKKRREVIKEAAANPFSLSLFENRIYWSDWSGSDIRTCDKATGNGTRQIMHADNIYGIHIYHPSIYLNSINQVNPCWSKHCSHLCLIGPSSSSFNDRKSGSVTASCACPESMMLNIGDRATCHEVKLSFLLINVKNYIAQVFPEWIGLHTIDKVIYSKDHTIHDVASDWLHYRLFFFDASKQHIYLVDLADKDIKIEQFLPTNQSIRGMLYDSWSDNLYWLDPDGGTISMCAVRSRYETVIRRQLDRPVSLVLDSRNRVFYIALLGKAPHIRRTDIFGNELNDVNIIGTDIGLPVALHLDEQQQRLYWADAHRETIESIDLDVHSQTSGIKANSRMYHRRRLGTILAFAVYHDSFLWTIKNGDYLYKAKMVGDNSRPIALKLPPNPSIKDLSSDNKRIIMVDPRHEVVSSPCEKRGCSRGCILDSNHEATCVAVREVTEPISSQDEIASKSSGNLKDGGVINGQSAILIANENQDKTINTWLVVLLFLVAITGLITLISLLILYKQGRLPRQVSHLSVSFIPQTHDKDGAMLLLDNDA